MLRLTVLLGVIGLTVPVFGADKGDAAWNSEEIAVYRAFLSGYTNGSGGKLNIGDRTTPFEIEKLDQMSGCLKGIELVDVQSAGKRRRMLSREIGGKVEIELVDAERQARIVREDDPSRKIGRGESAESAVKGAFRTALMQLSEIAFDTQKRYAVFSFSFSCGGLCGHGGMQVFEKVNGQWRLSKRPCGMWYS